MRIITLTYDPKSNLLTADSEGAGTSIDDCDVIFKLTPPEGLDLTGAVLELLYGVTIYNGGRRYPAKGRFNSDYETILSRQTLSACTGGTLPIRLHIVWPNRVVRTSRQTILQVDYIDDPDGDYIAAYGDMLMLRTDSWDWVREWTYQSGSFAVYDGSLWQSSKDDNVGNVPSDDSEWWSSVAVDGLSPTVEWDGDVLIVTDADGPHESPPLTGPQGEKGDKGDKGDTGDQGYSITAQWSGDRLIITDKDGPKTSPSLTGPQGEKGDTGAKGDKGDTGDAGEMDAALDAESTNGVQNAVITQNINRIDDELADKAEASALSSHVRNLSNPHQVTKAQVGLDKVDNTADLEKPVSTAMQAALNLKADESDLAGYVPTTRKVNGKALGTDITLSAADVGALPVGTHIPDDVTVDDALSDTSENPVQNKIIKAALDGKQPTGDYALASEIPDVSGFETSSHASSTYATKTEVTSGLEGKVDKVVGSRLMTDAEGSKLSGIAAGAQVNVLESVKVNNVAQQISGKAVNVTVPTKVSDLSNDSGFQTASQVATAVQNGVAGKQDDFTVVSVNLPASGWSSNQQTVAVSGVTASTEIVVVSYSPGSYQAYTEAGVRATAQGAGSLTFACDEAPSADLVAEVMYA